MGKVYSGEYYITTNEGIPTDSYTAKLQSCIGLVLLVLLNSSLEDFMKTVSPSACVQLIAVAQHSYVYRIGQLPQSNYKTIFNTHWRSNQGTANDLVDIHE